MLDKEKDKYSVGIHSFSAADVPEFQEIIKNKDWVFYGNDNNFPNHLMALYQYSAINRACLNAIYYGVKGRDILVEDGNDGRLLMANRSETLYEVFEKCVMDRVIFGGYALNIVKNNEGGIAEIYHMDFSKLRVGKEDDYGRVNHYYYSNDWTAVNKYKPIELPAFTTDPDEKPSQILYFKSYNPGFSYYPAPDYLGSLITIQMDIEVKNFHLNNIQNSMLPSLSITFLNGIPSEEQRDMLYRQLEAKYSSTNNAGKIFLFFAETPETAPIINPIPNNASDGWYSSIAPQIEQTILTGHRITSPMLLGIKTEGQLGGRQELLDSYELFSNVVIKPIQEEMLKDFQKVLFLRDKERVSLSIEQNEVISPEDIIEEIKTEITE